MKCPYTLKNESLKLKTVFLLLFFALLAAFPADSCAAWTIEAIDGAGYSAETNGLSIGVDTNNKVHISYYSNGDLKYATNASGSWVITAIDIVGDVGRSNSIAIDSNNKVHISYYDATNKYLKYATNTTGTWVKTTIDSTYSAGLTNAIAVDANNKVHIS